MKHSWNRKISGLLAAVMLFTMLPMTAMAEESDPNADPAAATVQAEKYTVALTATDGGRVSGGGAYAEGEEVTASAHPADGYQFDGWYDGGRLVSLAPVYTFAAAETVSYQAAFTAAEGETRQLTVTCDAAYTSSVTLTDGKADLALGTSVTLTFTDTTKEFFYWVNESNNILSTSAEYSFALAGNTTITAKYVEKDNTKTRVIFRNAFSKIIFDESVDKNAENLSASFDAGLNATPSKMGHTFLGWYLADENGELPETNPTPADGESIATAVSSSSRVVVLPRYKAIDSTYSITVTCVNEDGTKITGASVNPIVGVKVGQKQNVSAPKIENMTFQCWKIGDKIVGYDSVYTVLRAEAKNVALTAVYGDAVTLKPIVNITQTYATREGGKYVISNTMQYYLPEGYQLLEAGFVYGTSYAKFGTGNGESNLLIGANSTKRSVDSNTANRGLYTFNGKTANPATTLYIKAYIIYKNTDTGEVPEPVYSAMGADSYYSLTATEIEQSESSTPAVSVNEIKETAKTIIVTQKENDTVAATATVPQGVKLANDVAVSNGIVTLTVATKETTETNPHSISLVSQESINYSVSITGVDGNSNAISAISEDNATPILICLKSALDPGLTGVTAYHNGKLMGSDASPALKDANTFYYDPTTGDVYICVKHFSNFTFVYQGKYEATLDPNEGTFTTTPAAVAVTYGTPMPALPADAIPTREGHTFLGYFDAKENGTQYYNADGTSARTWNKSASAALYARWVQNGTVSFTFLNTDKYLYRVGNQNPVALSSLFATTGEVDTVSVETVTGASGEYNNGSLTFSGTGVVKVTVTMKYGGASATLPLEVVDAKNATSAMSATSNNVVLLNNIQFSTVEVSNGYGLYGNGFKMTSSNDISCKNFNSDNGYVNLKNGTIDNVQIICPYFTKSILYTNQATTDSNGYYKEVRNAVAVSGGSKSVITNCYIKGGRSAVFCGDTHLTVSSTTMEGGALANMLVHGTANIVLDDVSTIQRESVSTINTGKKILGLGIVVENETASISLNNTLTQENWITETQVEKYASAISSFLDFDDSTFAHEKDGVIYLNAGIIWIGNWDVQNIADNLPAKLEDNRAAKNTYSGADKTVSIGGVTKNGGIYTVNNTATTLTAVPAFSPSGHDVYPPVFSFDNEKNAIAYTDDNTPYCEYKNGTITLSTMQPSVTLDVSGITLMRNGEKVEYTLEVSPDADINGDNLTLNTNSPDYTVNITGTVYGFTKDGLVDSARGKEFSWKLPIHITKLAYPAPQWDEVSTTGSNHLWIVDKPDTTDPDYSDAIPIFNGIKVTYYNKAGELVNRDFSSETVEIVGNVATFDDESKLTITYPSNMTGYSYQVAENSDGNNTRYYYKTTYRNNRDSNTWQIKYSFTDPNGRSTENTITVNYSFSETSPGNYSSKGAFEQGEYESCNGEAKEIVIPCVPAGTLIALADGTQKPVEELTGNEELLVWDFDTASYASAPIVFIEPEPEAPYEIIRACFSDGTEVETTYEHGFFDYSRAKFIYINDDDPEQYIGDLFVMKDGDGWRTVELTSIERETKVTTVYGLTTYHHFNYFNNDMLSIEGNITGMFNYFEVDRDTMGYDQEKKQADIEKYGLLTYEDFEGIIDEFGFAAYNGQYLAVSVGKGLITWDGIKALADYYGHFTEGRVVNTQ